MANRVFLSYAHDNLEMVQKVYDGLVKRKVNVWFDKADLGPGKWLKQIMKAIPRSRFFLICISEAALRKIGDDKPGFQDDELNRAYEIAMAQPDSSFTIVPVRLEDCERGDVRLTTFQQYDLFENFEIKLDHLAVNLGGVSLRENLVEATRTKDQLLVESLHGKAETLSYAGEYEKVLGVIDLLLLLKPDVASTWNNKGIALGSLDRNEEALVAYNKSLEIEADVAATMRNKGFCLGNLGRYAEALMAYNKSLEIEADVAAVLNNKGFCLGKLGRYEEALEAFDKSLEINPDDAANWMNKGLSLRNLDRNEEALEAFDKSLELNPDDAAVWREKSNTLNYLERYEEALETFDKCLELNPFDVNALNGKALSLIMFDRHEEALVALDRCLEIEPDDSNALNWKIELGNLGK